MAKTRTDRLGRVIRDIETVVKRLRAELRRTARGTTMTKNLREIALLLRKRAALVAAQVERYVHELRLELLRGAAPARGAARRRRAA